MQPLSTLNGHPDRNKVPGVEANTGPLGHGLPIARRHGRSRRRWTAPSWRTFVLTGDGELQEGSNWEAIMAAVALRPRQPDGHRRSQPAAAGRYHRADGEPRAARRSLARVRLGRRGGGRSRHRGADRGRSTSLPLEAGRPTCVIARTNKGRGVSFIEDRVEWHHRVPTDAELAAALAELEESAR